MNIVLTGPAFNSAGQSIVRANLITACKASGHSIQGAIKADTDLLVASRADTVKAKRASGHAIKVMTYPTFIAQYLSGVDIPTEQRPSKYVDFPECSLPTPAMTVGFEVLELA